MDNIPYSILDIRGLMMRSLFGGEDPDGKLNEEGKVENSAEFGFNRFLDTVISQVFEISDPRRVIAVWDGGNHYRRGLFPGYKLKRSQREMSDYTTEQLKIIEDLVSSFFKAVGCTQLRVDRVEADDAIAYLCTYLKCPTFVFTVDRDLTQLHDNVTCSVLYQDVKDGFVFPEEGHYPHQVAITKSLLGDTSDEYPGVVGFGDAKLNAIVNEFGEDVLDDLKSCVLRRDFTDIEDALTVAQDPQSKQGLSLILKDTASWVLMYELAVLHPELCEGARDRHFAKLDWTKLVPNYHVLNGVLEAGGCPELMYKFEKYTPRYELVTNANWDAFVDRFMDSLEHTPFYAFDYESVDVLQHPDFNEAKRSGGDYVDVLSQSITGMSICYGQHLEYVSYISVDHADTDNVPDEYLKDILETVLEHGKTLVAHNAPFETALTDTNFLFNLDRVQDTRLMAQYVDENGSNHLKDLSKAYLHCQQATYADTLEAAGAENMQQMTGEQVLNYGCDDSLVTAQLCDLFYIILQLENTWGFCTNEEVATNAMLYKAFESGINIDYSRLKFLADEDEAEYNENMALLRNTLLINCNKVNEGNASELFNELSEFERAKMGMDEKPADQIDKKMAALQEKLKAGTRYEPLVEEPVEVKFTPTALQITKLAQSKFGLVTELKGVTPPKITEYLSNVEAEISECSLPEDEARSDFMDTLAGCSDELKKRQGPEFEKFIDLCKSHLSDGAATRTTGDELNLDSPAQMQILLYCKLGLPIRLHGKLQRGSTREKLGYYEGSPSADDKAIDTALAEDCPDTEEGNWKRTALGALKTAKACNTRRKNYWRPYPLWQHPRDGRVHGGISNCGTVTKRFTGSNPNLLQLSAKDGGRVRSIVLPSRDDHVILSPDFNGEELRITASLSLDPVMVDAYIGYEQKDLHSITAASIAGSVMHMQAQHMISRFNFEEVNGLNTLPYNEFLAGLESDDKEVAGLFKNIRKLAKGVNFLLIYVGGPSTLARNLGVPSDVAEQFLYAAFNTYARLEPWQQESIEFARTNGYVLTSYGNRRHLGQGLFSDDDGIRTRLERQAVNSQVQGTGSDIMKIVLNDMFKRNTLSNHNAEFMVAPYDEVAVSVPRSAAWDLWLEMQDIMTLTPPGHVVPQLPELKASALNWGTCVELGAFPTEEEFEETMDTQLAKKAAA